MLKSTKIAVPPPCSLLPAARGMNIRTKGKYFFAGGKKFLAGGKFFRAGGKNLRTKGKSAGRGPSGKKRKQKVNKVNR